ncbi:hypothetical protein CFC21_088525 [Triticum aestivum]|uniref:AT3G52170-like helix-turn-helix domain-containing protein n=2 Tax=Triticum aestivum TaxID=4565 RepID=A0A3B6PPG7_WHEAT|nr:uncharacterized protein LOC123137589 [Triticum aestivum]KAF7085035.1 hypothetical protein CFC21_088525 [Triticum aestivum]
MQAFARLSSPAASRKVVLGVSGAVTRPCYRTWRWKAHAAPLSAPDPPKGKKREWISKNERKARMKEFIEGYQASNDGRFPTMQMIRQSVGGGHYTIRDVLSEVKYNQIKFPFDKSKAAQLQETAEGAEQSRPEEDSGNSSFNSQSFNGNQDEDGTLQSEKDSPAGTTIMENTEALMSLDAKEAKLPLYNSEAAQLHETGECAEKSRLEESGSSTLSPDDTLLSQKDSAMGATIIENNQPLGSLESEDSSHYNGETEVAKQDSFTAVADANDLTVSRQAEIDSMKTEAPISLELETKSDCGNRQGETEVNKLHSNNEKKFQDPTEPTVSDQTEHDTVIKGNVLHREENPEVEGQGSSKTSLLGSLKSLASGIRNFWRNL